MQPRSDVAKVLFTGCRSVRIGSGLLHKYFNTCLFVVNTGCSDLYLAKSECFEVARLKNGA